MRIDGIQLAQGSNISNLVVHSGTSFPSSPDEGELFFRTDASTTIKGLYAYIGGSWDRLASSDSLTAPVGAVLPGTGNPGDLFYLDTGDAQEGLYAFNGAGWVAVAAGGSVSYSISGDVTGTIDGGTDALTLANTAVVPGSFGGVSETLTATVDSKGRVTAMNDVLIAISAAQTTSGAFADGRISQSSVTQHQGALALSASQLTTGTLADGRVTQSNVTQHQTALTITESQITDGTLLARLGGSETITGAWTFNNNITVPSVPLSSGHAASKSYVDNVAAGVNSHAAVRVATTGNITLSGTQTIDGIAVVAGDRVLVKDQTTASQNGVYDVTAGAWVRSSDFDGSPTNEVTPGDLVFVLAGVVNSNISYVLVTPGPITVGTTALSFSIFSRAADLVAGAGLTRAGNTIDVGTASSARIVVNTDSIDLATVSNSGTGSFVKLASDTYGRITGTTPVLAADITPLLGNITVVPSGTTTVVNVPADYATISAALVAVKNWIINGTVQIKVADGTHVLTTGITANHPFGTNIQIIGNQTTPANCVITVTGAPTFSAITVSDGNTLGLLDGFQFNLTSKAESANSYAAIIALYGAKITLGTKILVNNWYYGILAGNSSSIYAASAQVTNAGDAGIAAYDSSSIDAPNATANNCSDAVAALGTGFLATNGSMISCTGATATGNKIAGIGAVLNSNVRAFNANASTNTGSGFYVGSGSTIEANLGTASSNTRYGVETLHNGRVLYQTLTATGNTLGNHSPKVHVTNGSLGARIVADDGDLRIDNSGAFGTNFNTSSGLQFAVGHTATRDSYFQATGAAGRARLLTLSSLTDAAASIESKGAGAVRLVSNTQTAFEAVNAGASNVNYVRANGAATTFPVEVSAQGTDAAIGLNLSSKGAGAITFNTNNLARMAVSSAGDVTIATGNLTLPNTRNLAFAETTDTLVNIFRQASSAATVIANGYKYSGTSNGFASSHPDSWAKSAIALGSSAGGGSIAFYTDVATTVATGTDVTPSMRMVIASSGNVGISRVPTGGKLEVQGGYSAFFDTAGSNYLTIQPGASSIFNTSGNLQLNTIGVPRMLIDTNGNVSIVTPSSLANVSGRGQLALGGTTGGLVTWHSNNTLIGRVQSTTSALEIRTDAGGTAINVTATGIFSVTTGTSAFGFSVDSGGRLIAASGNFALNSRPIGGGLTSPKLTVATGDNAAHLAVQRYSADAIGPVLALGKSRGSIGVFSLISADDVLGNITFTGADSGTTLAEGARISAHAASAPGAGSLPSYLAFWTTGAGSNSTERMRIDTNGVLLIGTNALQAPGVSNEKLTVSGFISAGTGTSTNGTLILTGAYSSGALTTFGTEFSSGGPVIGYGARASTTAVGAFLSTTPISLARTALTQSDGFRFYTGTSQAVAIDSALTLTEKMRLDNLGNVGIGSTNPGPLGKFVVATNSTRYTSTQLSGIDVATFRWDDNSAPMVNLRNHSMIAANNGIGLNWTLGHDGTGADAGRIGVFAEQTWTATASTRDSFMQFATTKNNILSESARFSSDGVLHSHYAIRATGWFGGSGLQNNLGCEIGAAGGTAYVHAYNRNTSTYGQLGVTGSPIVFFNGSTEAGRIGTDSSFLLGTTASVGSSGNTTASITLKTAYSWFAHTDAGGVYIQRSNNTDGSVLSFLRGSTQVGSVSVTATATAYNISSDARLKKNVTNAPSAGAKIDSIQIRSFDWKVNDEHIEHGVIAQELAAVAPEAVTAGDTGEEVTKSWGVDYSKLVPLLVKEIQELRARVAALEAT